MNGGETLVESLTFDEFLEGFADDDNIEDAVESWNFMGSDKRYLRKVVNIEKKIERKQKTGVVNNKK